MLQYAHVRPPRVTESDVPPEILGFPLPPTLRQEIAEIDLLALRHPLARRIWVLESAGEAALVPLNTQLERLGNAVQYTCLPDPQLWEWVEDVNKVVVPPRLLQVIVSWLAEAYV